MLFQGSATDMRGALSCVQGMGLLSLMLLYRRTQLGGKKTKQKSFQVKF